MGFASAFSRLLSSSTSASSLTGIRFSSTLTSPRLFVSGLSRTTTDEKLRETFAPFGQLVRAKVMTDKISGNSRGFGFVYYTTVDAAQRAREEMNAKFLDGCVIFLDPANPKEFYRPPSQAEQPGWCR